MKAALLVSHGSKNKKCLEEIRITTEKIQTKLPECIVDYAFMELESPDIPTGIKNCIEKGATEVLVLLNFLNAGRHTIEDIPAIVKPLQNHYSDVKITISSPVGQEEGMVDLFKKLIDEA